MTENELMMITCDYLPNISLTDDELEDKLIFSDYYGNVANKKILKDIVEDKKNQLNMECILSDLYEWNEEIFNEMAFRQVLYNARDVGDIIPDDIDRNQVFDLVEDAKRDIVEFYEYSGYSVENALMQYVDDNQIAMVIGEYTFRYEDMVGHFSSNLNLGNKDIVVNSCQQLMFKDLYYRETSHEFNTKRTDIYDPYYLYDTKPSEYGLLINYGAKMLFY